MAGYKTKQRKALLDFLLQHPDEALTARQIADALQSEGISISAVYRNLAALEMEGMIKRISKPGLREAFFQYVNAPTCRDSLHLSCKQCGKTFHMDASGAAQLAQELEKADGFVIDKSETILYGTCDQCRKDRRES